MPFQPNIHDCRDDQFCRTLLRALHKKLTWGYLTDLIRCAESIEQAPTLSRLPVVLSPSNLPKGRENAHNPRAPSPTPAMLEASTRLQVQIGKPALRCEHFCMHVTHACSNGQRHDLTFIIKHGRRYFHVQR